MKNKVLYFFASVVLLPSCTDEVQELANEPSQALKQIVMTTQDFQPEASSRTLYEIGEAVKCTWAANDTVGVFPEEGAQAYFPMALGEGTKNATFDGKGWALKDGRTYGAYYPCIGKFYLDRNAVPVSYIGQIQTGNASTVHLGAYDYMVATPTTSEFGSAHFTFKHLSALVQLKITIPVPAALTSVKLVADTEAFAVKGEVDIMADAPSIKPVDSAKEIVLNLQDVATTEENQVVTFYMMIPPVDLSGQTLKVMVSSDKGADEIAFEGKKFASGIAYGLSGELKTKEGGYKDGVVTLAEAGSMSKLLENDWLSITSLKVVGPINGDDVRCLRQMLGGSDFNDTEKGELAILDLSEASIVEGGGWYYDYYASKYYTFNDAIGDYMFYDCDNLQNIVLPDGVTSIGEYAFYLCHSLTFIDVPDSVNTIGKKAFRSCSSLVSIKIPDGVTAIGYRTFLECRSLTTIDIPNGVNIIGEEAFCGCSSLTSIYVPNSVTTIGQNAFGYCSSLTSIYITDLSAWCNITFSSYYSNPLNKGAKLYLNNGELTELVIPADIKRIKDYAFYGCKSIKKVTMGADVTSIGIQSFRNCSSLTQVYCNGTTPPTINPSSANSSFNGSSENRTLYVPADCVSKYQSSDWGTYFTSIVEIE